MDGSTESLGAPLVVTESTHIRINVPRVGISQEKNKFLSEAVNGMEKTYQRIYSNPNDELRKFRSSLWYLGLDQSTTCSVIFSWVIFILLTLVVPVLNYLFVRCPHCDSKRSHPFELLTEVSESSMAAISFLSLSNILRVYGLRKALLLDFIIKDSPEVQRGYKDELQRAFHLLAEILLPCFLVELVHKIWWFQYVAVLLPPAGTNSPILKNVITCSILMAAWLYKTSVFIVICVMFKLFCSLQTLRLNAYEKLLEAPPDVSAILLEHMRIRVHLLEISHRFRFFMVASLFAITSSQFSALFAVASSTTRVNFFRAGDLAVCSAVQLTGCFLCLSGAASITHRAQRVVSLVSQWHAIVSCTLYSAGSVPINELCSLTTTQQITPPVSPNHPNPSDDSEAFQRRQALVAYLHHCPAGISLYGFVLDRGTLYALFGIEFSLVLWILGKTVGIH
ncbi:hypothetical protein O6H91_05G075800 [Diphasiastrum complanatum]|uniref:Uncharacterized protein n=1 Tax=Diphasiastrum complanatum TaxID=34168 RepID=A0ACC2DQ61_DIPCM|nr:hypothetical protein O6H91_05G075800 [Diphasiastrum complanatum]